MSYSSPKTEANLNFAYCLLPTKIWLVYDCHGFGHFPSFINFTNCQKQVLHETIRFNLIYRVFTGGYSLAWPTLRWISKTPVARCPLRVASWHKNARCWQKNTRWCPKNARWHNNACCSENMLTWFHPLPTQKHPLNCALSMECKNALRKIFTYLVLGRDEIRGWHPRNYTKMSSHILNTITLIRADYRL